MSVKIRNQHVGIITGSALLAFVLTPGLCSIIAVLFGKSTFKKAKTKI
ncbi:hypothetical protein G3G02_004830 [Salmonella enterica subsp. enterica]|nr:hypothetical protein [Salmonella enterica subsp. enterica]